MHSLKQLFLFCTAWLATVNSTSMVYEIRSICTAFLGNCVILLLHDYYYLTNCGIHLSRALIQSKTRINALLCYSLTQV